MQQWLKQEYPRIKALAQREKAEIYFGDAPHMRSDHHSGRPWGRMGKTRVVSSTGARYGMSLISAVTSREPREAASTCGFAHPHLLGQPAEDDQRRLFVPGKQQIGQPIEQRGQRRLGEVVSLRGDRLLVTPTQFKQVAEKGAEGRT